MPDITDYTEELDYNALKNKIKSVLRRYFEHDDCGDSNEEYDPNYLAEDAISDIRDIIGEI